ncbi:hypothetical protein BDFB_004172, partial [Asbolus verrucosus]
CGGTLAAWPATRRLEVARSSHAVVGGGRARGRGVGRYTGRAITNGGRLQLRPGGGAFLRATCLLPDGARVAPTRPKPLGPPSRTTGTTSLRLANSQLANLPTCRRTRTLPPRISDTFAPMRIVPQRLIHRIVTFEALHALDPLQNRIRLLGVGLGSTVQELKARGALPPRSNRIQNQAFCPLLA